MNSMKCFAVATLLAVVLVVPFSTRAEEKKTNKTKPYPLKTCVVSDEKLGGDMGEPYIFKQDGKEVRLCCKACLKDFKKDQAKYMKKIESAEKKNNKS